MDSDSQNIDVCSEQLGNPPLKKVKREPEPPRTPDGGFKINTYYPTWDEMKDFSAFMKKIHADNGNRAGLAKIIPPPGYQPRKAGYDDEELYEMEITHPIKQEVTGEGGLYQQLNVMGKRKMTVRAFKRLSEEKHPTPEYHGEDLDRAFWKNIFTNPSMYGADVPGTLFDPDFEYFNLTKLDTILDNIQDDYGVTIEGVNTTYLYFGMWKSSFCWHTEDVDLYSINYLHFGAPKSWYCIAPENGKRFERLAASFFPHSFKGCKAFLRHKTTLISPAILKKYGIPFSRCTQQPGEFMVTFPYSYHSGYNHGFNIAEATNFALEYWIDYGKWATRCECSSESVKISMQTFVKRYQADRYEDWIRGRDFCSDPRDPKHKGPAPRPNEYDLYLRGAHERTEAEIIEEEQNKKEIALQQNLSSNLKKSKASKKSNKLETAYQRYSEYLKAHDSMNHQETTSKTPLPHFSPVPSQMTDVTGQYHMLSKKSPKMDLKEKPDYDRFIKKCVKKLKPKKEDKSSQKKEKRAKERMIMSQELLHYLPTTFTQEKKFNRCIAAQPPHCSICQLLVPHPKDDETIWGTKVTTESNNTQSEFFKDPESQSTSNSQHDCDNPLAATLPPVVEPQNVEFKVPASSNILLPRISFKITEDKQEEEGSEEPAPVEDRHNTVTNGQPDVEMSEDGPVDQSMGAEQDDATRNTEQDNETREADSGYGDFLDFDLDKPSELLQCTVCMLAVHRLCYGLDKSQDIKADWICDRCNEANRSTIFCALCPCRGGALKKINDTWVHITCALTLSEVTHADLTTRKTFKLPKVPARTNCTYCMKNMNLPKYIQGYTVRCIGFAYLDGTAHKCTNTFHPTCGHRNGAIFDTPDFHDNFPKLTHIIRAMCPECQAKTQPIPIEEYEAAVEKESNLEPIKDGAKVIVELRKGYLIDAYVVERKPAPIYDVFFPELSTVELHISERMLVIPDKSKELRLGDEVLVKSKSVPGGRTGKIMSKRLTELEYVIRHLSTNQLERVRRRDIYLNIDQLSEEQIASYLGELKPKPPENVSTG